jgi:NAD(P)-dependent dehydrogenase (short-subunit alcohol dehydrogenase family)
MTNDSGRPVVTTAGGTGGIGRATVRDHAAHDPVSFLARHRGPRSPAALPAGSSAVPRRTRP